MAQTFYSIGLTVFFILLFFSLLTFVFQRKLIYIPDKGKPSFVLAKQYGLNEVFLQTNDGLDLLAWYKKAKEGKATIIHFHGNAGNIAYRLPIAKYFIDNGFGILLVEYRGYGGNLGHPSEQGLYKDGQSAIAFLQAQHIPLSSTVLYGESLGTGVAVAMSVHYPACALILQSPYTSMFELAKSHYPWVLVKPWDRYNSLEKIGAISTPVLILHGKMDEIVPYHQAQQLFSAVNAPKQFVLYPERGHNDLWHQDFYQKVILFVEQHCPGSSN